LVIKRDASTDNVFSKSFNSLLSEFSTSITYSELFERKLLEYGNVIIKDKVFNKIKKWFMPL